MVLFLSENNTHFIVCSAKYIRIDLNGMYFV